MSVWRGLTVAFVGGDARETEMAALAAAEGAAVRVFGTPQGQPAIPGVVRARTLAEALLDASVAVGPVPLPGPDGRIYAPSWPDPIHIRQDELRGMRRPGHVVIGRADQGLVEAAREAGVTVHEYESDTELMLLRAPAVAEGAVRVAIERSPVTIHATNVGVVGFGRIGRVLVRTLLGLGARVDVFARRAEARAEAYAMGAVPHDLGEAPAVAGSLEMLFSTVPARIVTADVLRHLPPGALVVDLAAPPGSVDQEAARALGLDAVWARGLGASAPRTVGRQQWAGVTRIVGAALGRGG